MSEERGRGWLAPAVIVALLALMLGVIAYVWPRAPAGTAVGPQQVQSAQPSEAGRPPEPSDPSPVEDAPTEDAPTDEGRTDEPTEDEDSDPPGGVATVKVDVDDASISVGKRVGPKKWQLEEWGDTPTVRVTVAWEARTAENARIDGDSCEMKISLSGPEDPPSFLSAECSQETRSSFNPTTALFEMTTAGRYKVTVRDAVSGVSESATFTVIS